MNSRQLLVAIIIEFIFGNVLTITILFTRTKLISSLQKSTSLYRTGKMVHKFAIFSQIMDFTSLYHTVDELQHFVAPSMIENVVQESSHNIAIGIKTLHDGNKWLHLCWHPLGARLGISYAPPRGDTIPYSFATTLRSLLKGCSITGVKISRVYERIVVIDISPVLSAPSKWRLIVEIMGAKSNVILASADTGTIQACAYQVPPSKSFRPLQTSIEYKALPAIAGAFLPHEVNSPAQFQRQLQLSSINIESSLVTTYHGMSPNIARYLLSLCQLKSNLNTVSVSKESFESLFQVFLAWLHSVDMYSTSQSPTSYVAKTIPLILSPSLSSKPSSPMYCPITIVPRNADDTSEPIPSDRKEPLLTFLQHFYGESSRVGEFTVLRAACRKRLNAHVKRAQNLAEEFGIKLEDARLSHSSSHCVDSPRQ